MKYVNKSFTMPTTNKDMTALEYDLRVGKITQTQYDAQTAGKAHIDVQGVEAPAARVDSIRHTRRLRPLKTT